MENNIGNIIRIFFEKEASKNTQILFRKWFRMEDHQVEKENMMEELWESSPSNLTTQTLEDFSKLQSLISKQDKPKRNYSLLRRIVSYAAAIALIITTSVYLTYRLAIPSPLEYTQLSVSYGKSEKLTLSDGTVVTVNAGSTLIYPKDFTAGTRTVFLSGEANFSVASNPDKPFIVKTKYIDTRVLGTKFCIQSYPNAKYTKVTLIEGRIKINTETDQNKSYILQPNNQLIYYHADDTVSIIDVDAAKLASWEDGYLIFQEATFDEIVQTLERKYNVVINYDGKKLSRQSYYVKFNPDETIEEVLEVLSMLINQSDYKIENSTIYFYMK